MQPLLTWQYFATSPTITDMKNESVNWNLDDIVKLDEFDALYDLTKKEIEQFKNYFDLMSPYMTEEDFAAFSKHHEKTVSHLHRLDARPGLMETVDKADSLALKLKNRVKDLEVLFSEQIQPINLWIKGKQVADKPVLDDINAARLFKAIPDLEYVYTYSRTMGKYSLDEQSENIITAKDANGTSVIVDLREITETEQMYKFTPKGEKAKTMNGSELSAYTYSIHPEERKAAFQSRFKEFKKNIHKYFVMYQAVVKDWDYETKLRGFDSPISMRNKANHIQDNVIETLVAVCVQNNAVFQRYFKFKAQELGMKKLTRFDIYAPLGETNKTITYEQALKDVLGAYESFSPNFSAKAWEIIHQNHIDSHPGNSKRSGAFCMTVGPEITPYVLLNFAGKFRDVSTLAHELGHGIHSLYANKHSISAQHANLPLAETASTFGEMVLFEKFLNETNDNQLKKQLLSDKLADSYASICRQNYFTKFEMQAHEAISKGIEEKDLSQMWLDTLTEQFGDSVEVDQIFRYEWSYIPHIIHTPFYCYSYNFGELLSMALYARYKEEGDSFVPKIEEILAAGGSQDPDKVLREVGINMASAEFWQGSFDLIKHWQDQLEQL